MIPMPQRRSHRPLADDQRSVHSVAPRSRLNGETGSAVVAALVLVLAMTGGASIWLARDVGIALSQSGVAHEIAFEVARHGAQQIDVAALRDGSMPAVTLDAAAVREMVPAVFERALSDRAVSGRLLDLDIDGDTVIVVVVIDGGTSPAIGRAAARAVIGP